MTVPWGGAVSVHVTLGLEFDDITWEQLMHLVLEARDVGARSCVPGAPWRALAHAALTEVRGLRAP